MSSPASVIICDFIVNKAVSRPRVLSTGHFMQWVFGVPWLADWETSSCKGRECLERPRLGVMALTGIRDCGALIWKMLDFCLSSLSLTFCSRNPSCRENLEKLRHMARAHGNRTKKFYRKDASTSAFPSVKWGDGHNGDNRFSYRRCPVLGSVPSPP